MRFQIDDRARKYLERAVPFTKRGRSMDGVDCYGLLWLVNHQDLGIDLPSHSHDFEPEDTSAIERLIEARMTGFVRVDQPQYGDGIVFWTNGAKSHIGVWVAPRVFIHANDNAGRVSPGRLPSLEFPQSRVEGIYRYQP